MPDWLSSRLPDGWTGWHVSIFVASFAIASALGSVLAVGIVLTRIPADYFVYRAERGERRHPFLAFVLLLVRNAFGYFLIALGAILSLPGVPGQGLLTILIGVMLVDFPGKYRFERWLITRRVVFASANKLRARLGRPPLITPLDTGEK